MRYCFIIDSAVKERYWAMISLFFTHKHIKYTLEIIIFYWWLCYEVIYLMLLQNLQYVILFTFFHFFTWNWFISRYLWHLLHLKQYCSFGSSSTKSNKPFFLSKFPFFVHSRYIAWVVSARLNAISTDFFFLQIYFLRFCVINNFFSYLFLTFSQPSYVYKFSLSLSFIFTNWYILFLLIALLSYFTVLFTIVFNGVAVGGTVTIAKLLVEIVAVAIFDIVLKILL